MFRGQKRIIFFIFTHEFFQKIGEDWINNLDLLKELKKYDNNPGFLEAIARVKSDNKVRLAQYVKDDYGIDINPSSMYDIHVSFGFFNFYSSYLGQTYP